MSRKIFSTMAVGDEMPVPHVALSRVLVQMHKSALKSGKRYEIKKLDDGSVKCVRIA